MKAGCPYGKSHHVENYDYCKLTNKKIEAADDKCDFDFEKCPEYRAQKTNKKQK